MKLYSVAWPNLVRFWGTFWWWILVETETVWDATAVPRSDPTGVEKKKTFCTTGLTYQLMLHSLLHLLFVPFTLSLSLLAFAYY